jgi:tRNA threonylcarbamoyladenosine biosynthesis protein TsaB
MRILALDSALKRRSAGVVIDGRLVSERHEDASRDHAAVLPVMADDVLREAGIAADALDFVAVTVGPGGFTGIRAALALAHGIALGIGKPVIGVTVGEAIADALPRIGVRSLWVAVDSRRGKVFLECIDGDGASPPGGVTAVQLDRLPRSRTPIAVAGDAALTVAAWMAARGTDVMLTDARVPWPRHVAMAALRRITGELPPLPPQPLYVDPPEARLPAGGLRPLPAG